jgi:hypothetical protein
VSCGPASLQYSLTCGCDGRDGGRSKGMLCAPRPPKRPSDDIAWGDCGASRRAPAGRTVAIAVPGARRGEDPCCGAPRTSRLLAIEAEDGRSSANPECFVGKKLYRRLDESKASAASPPLISPPEVAGRGALGRLIGRTRSVIITPIGAGGDAAAPNAGVDVLVAYAAAGEGAAYAGEGACAASNETCSCSVACAASLWPGAEACRSRLLERCASSAASAAAIEAAHALS